MISRNQLDFLQLEPINATRREKGQEYRYCRIQDVYCWLLWPLAFESEGDDGWFYIHNAWANRLVPQANLTTNQAQ